MSVDDSTRIETRIRGTRIEIGISGTLTFRGAVNTFDGDVHFGETKVKIQACSSGLFLDRYRAALIHEKLGIWLEHHNEQNN